MLLFLAFLLIPLIEIALFIQIGGLIGLWPTLAIVVITAVLGTILVRSQGQAALFKLRSSFNELSDPTQPLAEGAMILVAGALLLTPGFFTDAVGFALLMPPVRAAVYRYMKSRMSVTTFQMGPDPRYPPGRGPVIDGEFEEVNPQPRRDGQPSGWVDGPDRH